MLSGWSAGFRPSLAMTTAVTSPASSGARRSTGGRGLFRSRSSRWQVTAISGLVIVILAVASLLVVSDRSARTEIRATDVSLASAQRQLAGLRSQLTHVERNLAGARAWRAGVTRSFERAQATLSSTESALAQAQANVYSQGVDIGKLDACVSVVEQALNQISVGQTSGGLATLRASSSSCSALTETA